MAQMEFDLWSSFKMLTGIVGIYTALKILIMVGMGIVGAVANVFTSGDITVTAAFQTALNDTATSAATNFTTLGTQDALLISLVALVVILNVFKPIIADYMQGKGRGRSMN